MDFMFMVRSARALAPTQALSRSLSVHACRLRRRHTQHPHASRPYRIRRPHARLSTRQNAPAFNQQLSFDTSKATARQLVFSVRSARPGPGPPQALSRALARARRVRAAVAPTPSHRASHADDDV